METPDRLPVLSPEFDDDELLALAVADPQDADYRPWQIDNPRQAEWAMRKVSQAEAEIFDATQHADYWRHEIDEWFICATNRAMLTKNFLGHCLEEWALDVREESGDKVKTVVLPAGEVRTRSDGSKVVVVDEAKLIEWCESPNTLSAEQLAAVVKVEKSILVSKLRELTRVLGESTVALIETGEVVPGVDVMPERITAKVVTR